LGWEKASLLENLFVPVISIRDKKVQEGERVKNGKEPIEQKNNILGRCRRVKIHILDK
jgi:hypothetical protein